LKETITELNLWLESLSQFSLPNWDGLPDLDLYMDQVVTYLERELHPLTASDTENIITPWMINNYVKGKLIPIPEKKKYSKEHLAYMIAICVVKQTLSINDIKQFLDSNKFNNVDIQTLYDFIRDTQKTAIEDIATDAKGIINPLLNQTDDDEVTKELYDYATNLAIEASIKKNIANRIFTLINNMDEIKHKELEAMEKIRIEKEMLEKEKSMDKKNPKINK
jgi:DNA-binding transcriptional MerR regulator